MDVREMILFKNWVVVGDVLTETKYASMILKKFKSKGYSVSGVNPKGGEGVYTSLKDVPYKIDAIDLCINAKIGLEIVKEAKELGIKNILVQPGAESDDILRFCKQNSIVAIQNCALVQLNNL